MEGVKLACNGPLHKKGQSNLVEIQYFRRVIDDPNSDLRKMCLECRLQRRKYDESSRKRLAVKKTTLLDTEFLCGGCRKIMLRDHINVSGVLCDKCKDVSIDRHRKEKALRLQFKYECIAKNEMSCNACKCIFIRNENKIPTVELPLINGMITYNGESYLPLRFIAEFKHLLALDILEFDHLPESHVKKRKMVSQACSIQELQLESLKCQLCCSKCHLRATLSRFQIENKKQPYVRSKRVYIDNCKLKIGKCNLCSSFDSTLLAFYEFDHIDPQTKIASVASMITESYTIDDITLEISKCRLLCKFCHRYHTNLQKTGVA